MPPRDHEADLCVLLALISLDVIRLIIDNFLNSIVARFEGFKVATGVAILVLAS